MHGRRCPHADEHVGAGPATVSSRASRPLWETSWPFVDDQCKPRRAGVTPERVLSIGAAGLVAASGFGLMVGGAGLLLTAVRYIGAGGLEAVAGGLILPAGALALFFVASAVAGLGMALRGGGRLGLLTGSSGVAVLVWSAVAMGSQTGPEWAWLMAAGSGAGLLLLLGWW